ncbi:hypothetical protein SCHPADRAFT_417404 [Schizopora paradoxa]|uniref:Uncharacterized protein n=1 Tax=Schizopora paradoxa TaxID=27342 RepID=A0A0H2RSR6_9AGAM|nr:hypothetical protein SCHPADRAFT_417404 [Schizopora paradoxa]
MYFVLNRFEPSSLFPRMPTFEDVHALASISIVTSYMCIVHAQASIAGFMKELRSCPSTYDGIGKTVDSSGLTPCQSKSRFIHHAVALALILIGLVIYSCYPVFLALFGFFMSLFRWFVLRPTKAVVTRAFNVVLFPLRLVRFLAVSLVRFVVKRAFALLLCTVVFFTALWMSEDRGALLETMYSGTGVFSPTKTLADGVVFVGGAYLELYSSGMAYYSRICGEWLLRALVVSDASLCCNVLTTYVVCGIVLVRGSCGRCVRPVA